MFTRLQSIINFHNFFFFCSKLEHIPIQYIIKKKVLKMSHLNIDSLPDPGERFVLEEIIGVGVCAKVI